MAAPDLAKIRRLATDVRLALEAIKSTLSSPQIKEFPSGACGDASILLARYLEKNGCGVFEICEGYCNGDSHRWLRQGAVVVDITADQLPGAGLNKVIVEPNSAWHEGLHESCSCEDWQKWFNEGDYARDYGKLVAHIRLRHSRLRQR